MAAHILEERRLREVRKYYVPDVPPPAGAQSCLPLPNNLTTPVSNQNKTLTALMQLIACRLGMQRAMVSVVEQHAQHFLAESTRTIDLEDISRHEDGDDLWMGCGWTKRSEALCARTIDLPSSSEQYACFSVCDLSKDERFHNLPYVANSPHFRFYAGTPLITSRNIPIGSVFVIDDRPRGPPNKFEIDFLGIMARNVMEYLEMRRESEMRSRNERMIRCLAAFVDGKSTISDDCGTARDVEPPTMRLSDGGTESEFNDSLVKSQQPDGSVFLNGADRSPLSSLRHSSNGNDPSFNDRHDVSQQEEIPTQHRILSRASKLLRESLDLDCTIFFDVKASSSVAPETSAPGADEISHEGHPEHENLMAQRDRKHTHRPSRAGIVETLPANLLSFATLNTSSYEGDVLGTEIDFRSPDLESLQQLMRRYPEGRLWSYSDAGIVSSEGDDLILSTLPQDSPGTINLSSKEKDTDFLAYSFPGARHILFAPLWDVETGSHIAACFAVSTKIRAVFDNEADTAFVRGFLNSISIACGKAKLETANRQKGDFISSISHELRSPLHGILASAELLTESKLDNSQAEFCNTILTCGQSLLETISDILEYTKINTLRDEARATDTVKYHSNPSPSIGVETSTTQRRGSDTLTPFDVAEVCEDAVNAISTAYRFYTSTSDQGQYRVLLPRDANDSSESKSVAVIIHINPGDWKFCGLPGPIQRIVMNLVGNSLKYTHSGFVAIRLRQYLPVLPNDSENQNKASQDTATVEIIVTDTGKGISKEFLETKLFTPFSQESTLAPGTGLGLNIVHSLVQLQRGTIDVTSDVATGTKVVVRLPLQRPGILENSSQNHDHIISAAPKTTFSLHGFKAANAVHVAGSLRRYLTEWYGIQENNDTGTNEGFVIVDEEECSSWIGISRQRHKVIVVCDQSTRRRILQKYSKFSSSFEVLTTPFGPHKFFKVLIASFETSEESTRRTSPTSDSDESDRDHDRFSTLPIHEKQPTNHKIPISPVYKSPRLSENLMPGFRPSKQARVLCVDDNAINLRLLKTFMDKLGFQDVACAENGSIAFETVRLRPERFDLIFMDLSMPVCDGFESTSLIRSLEKLQSKIPTLEASGQKPALIVAVTGLANQRDHDAARAVGIDHFLSKPLKLSKLRELLGEWGILL